MYDAKKAYDEDGKERKRLLEQIRLLVGIIGQLRGDVCFTHMFDALNATTLGGADKRKVETTRKIMALAREKGIAIDPWRGLLKTYVCGHPVKTRNDHFRNFVFDHREELGGCFVKAGRNHYWRAL